MEVGRTALAVAPDNVLIQNAPISMEEVCRKELIFTAAGFNSKFSPFQNQMVLQVCDKTSTAKQKKKLNSLNRVPGAHHKESPGCA